MSQHFTMQLEREGPAKNQRGELSSGDLFYAEGLPRFAAMLDRAAQRLHVIPLRAFWRAHEQAISLARRQVHGRSPAKVTDDTVAQATLDSVDRAMRTVGEWFEPEWGIRTATAILEYLQEPRRGLNDAQRKWIMADLSDMVDALKIAKRRRRRFRLRYSY